MNGAGIQWGLKLALLLLLLACECEGAYLRGGESRQSESEIQPPQKPSRHHHHHHHHHQLQHNPVSEEVAKGVKAPSEMSAVPVQIQPASKPNDDLEVGKSEALVQESSRSHPVSLMEVQSKAKASLGTCQTCVFVLERIKKGTNMLLPSICSELFAKSYKESYSMCHQVLNSLQNNGNNVRFWLFTGCNKYESYEAKEWVKPCPSHVMCSVMKSLEEKKFCKTPKMDVLEDGE